MSLDFYLQYDVEKDESIEVFSRNITHNLGKMADAAGIYEALWRPYRLKPNYKVPKGDYNAERIFEDENASFARDVIPLLEKGLADLKARPEYFEKFNAENGWGLYEHFVPFVEEVLEACKKYPNARIYASR